MSEPLTENEKLLLLEHLPYELDMLDHCMAVISDPPAFVEESQAWLNMTIECAFLHIRSILEFFWRTDDAEKRTGSAHRFTTQELQYEAGSKQAEIINDQILHLNLKRDGAVVENNEVSKIAISEATRRYEAISRDVQKFQLHLNEQAKAIWEPRPARYFKFGETTVKGSSAHSFAIHGYTGPVGPVSGETLVIDILGRKKP